MTLYSELDSLVRELTAEGPAIPEDRLVLLDQLSSYVGDRLESGSPVRLNFICTHNSRRSQISQVWASVAAALSGLQDVKTFSGGTEATAFNARAIAALERAGFRIENPGGDNPRCLVRFSDDAPPVECFSKVFDHPENPGSDFAAVMTCSHADENCPFIPGARRIAIPFDDPGEADGTPLESATYDERVREIGREILFAVRR